MNKRIAVVISALLCTLALAACDGTTFTQWPGGGKAEFSDLNKEVENLFEVGLSDIAFDVELEAGSVDIEVVDVTVFADSDDYVELDTIYNAEGLVSGDKVTCTDDDGSFVLRINGHDATGTINISES